MTTDSSQANTSSTADPFGRSQLQRIFELCIAAIIWGLTIIGNGLIIFAIRKFPSLDTITNSFIENLAYTDLAMALIQMPLWFTALAYGDWILGTWACSFFGYAKFVLINASLNTLLLIAMNRYLKIVKMKLYRKIFKSKRMVIVLKLLSWLIPIVIYSPPLYGWGNMIYYPKSALCSLEMSTKSISYIVFIVLSQPAPYIICFCYIKILGTVKSNRVQVCSMKNRGACLRAQEAESKILLTTFAIVCVFVLCLTPSVVSAVLYATGVSAPRDVHATFTFFLFSNYALNSVIYGVMNPQLKAAIIRILNCKYNEERDGSTIANTEVG